MINTSEFSALTFCESLDREAFHQQLAPEVFHPIGIRYVGAEPVDVYYFPDSESHPDQEWITGQFPQSVEKLAELLKEAFKQYCGDEWCGAEMREEILEELEDEDTYGPKAVALFKRDGYVPFFAIQAIYLSKAKNAVIIGGSIDIDFNLDEHGADILIQPSGVKFGYGADFDEMLND